MPPPSAKPRVVKDYDKLDEAVAEQIKLAYPRGYHKHLVRFTNAKGDEVSALPFETDDRYYLVRMTVREARALIADDDDYDEEGNLRPKAQRAYAAKHDDDDEDDVDDADDLAGELGGESDDFGDDDDYAAALADGAPEELDDELGPTDDEDDGGGEDRGPRQVSLDGIDVVDPGSV